MEDGNDVRKLAREVRASYDRRLDRIVDLHGESLASIRKLEAEIRSILNSVQETAPYFDVDSVVRNEQPPALKLREGLCRIDKECDRDSLQKTMPYIQTFANEIVGYSPLDRKFFFLSNPDSWDHPTGSVWKWDSEAMTHSDIIHFHKEFLAAWLAFDLAGAQKARENRLIAERKQEGEKREEELEAERKKRLSNMLLFLLMLGAIWVLFTEGRL